MPLFKYLILVNIYQNAAASAMAAVDRCGGRRTIRAIPRLAQDRRSGPPAGPPPEAGAILDQCLRESRERHYWPQAGKIAQLIVRPGLGTISVKPSVELRNFAKKITFVAQRAPANASCISGLDASCRPKSETA